MELAQTLALPLTRAEVAIASTNAGEKTTNHHLSAYLCTKYGKGTKVWGRDYNHWSTRSCAQLGGGQLSSVVPIPSAPTQPLTNAFVSGNHQWSVAPSPQAQDQAISQTKVETSSRAETFMGGTISVHSLEYISVYISVHSKINSRAKAPTVGASIPEYTQ